MLQISPSMVRSGFSDDAPETVEIDDSNENEIRISDLHGSTILILYPASYGYSVVLGAGVGGSWEDTE
jgi:hypothetical protein